MNHAVAVDASLAVKWVVDEQHTDRARALLVASADAGRPIVGPPHLPGEVTSAIYQRWRSIDPDKHLDDAEALDALRWFLAFRIELLTPPDLYEQAFTFAMTSGVPSIYLSMYVVLAQLMGVELWTADERLLRLLGANAPWVRFIGNYAL